MACDTSECRWAGVKEALSSLAGWVEGFGRNLAPNRFSLKSYTASRLGAQRLAVTFEYSEYTNIHIYIYKNDKMINHVQPKYLEL